MFHFFLVFSLELHPISGFFVELGKLGSIEDNPVKDLGARPFPPNVGHDPLVGETLSGVTTHCLGKALLGSRTIS